MSKEPDAFKTISEVAEQLRIPQHVLRFWETRFPQLKPMKRGGRRRYYRSSDVDFLTIIRILLYDKGYTIKGVQKLIKDYGISGLLQMYQRNVVNLNDSAVSIDAYKASIDTYDTNNWINSDQDITVNEQDWDNLEKKENRPSRIFGFFEKGF